MSSSPKLLERMADWASASLRFRLRIAVAILAPHVKGKRIVEVGCGSGLLMPALFEHGATHYTGIDISEAAIGNARKLAQSAGVESKTNLYVSSITDEREPFEGDIVFSLGLLDWLSDDELDRLFQRSGNADFLHAIAEKRLSVSQAIHRSYCMISYMIKNGGYGPRYFTTQHIESIAKKYCDKKVFPYRDRGLSFGALLSTIPLDGAANIQNVQYEERWGMTVPSLPNDKG